jgi:2'-5' RNA ligase
VRKSLRLFFAVDFEKSVQDAIEGLKTEVCRHFEGDPRSKNRRWAWVPKENYHLTMKFLGAVPEEKIPEILSAVENAVRKVSSFSIEAKGAGAFPRVLWIGADDPSFCLAQLALQIDQALEPLKFPRETRAFVPHLTIARLKEGKPLRPDLDLKLEWATLRLGQSRIREIVLYESETLPSGAIYRPLGRIPLEES